MPFSARELLKFYNAATLVLDGGTGERYSLLRGRDLDDDQCLVFEDDDDCFLFRIEDFSLDKNGDAWVHGAWLSSAAQLPTETLPTCRGVCELRRTPPHRLHLRINDLVWG